MLILPRCKDFLCLFVRKPAIRQAEPSDRKPNTERDREQRAGPNRNHYLNHYRNPDPRRATEITMKVETKATSAQWQHYESVVSCLVGLWSCRPVVSCSVVPGHCPILIFL